jgi:hypothetical protein
LSWLPSVHLLGHKSTIVFERPGWIRFSRVNDGVSRTFPLFVGQVVTQGAIIVLPGKSPIVEISGGRAWAAANVQQRERDARLPGRCEVRILKFPAEA